MSTSTSTMKSIKATWDTVWPLLLVALIAHLQFKNWILAHSDNLTYLTDAYEGVLSGTPHWRAYQNRLLSPALVKALGWFSAQPLALFTEWAVLALDVGLFLAVRALTRSNLAGVLAVVVCALVWVLEQHNSSYTWDLTEAGCLLAMAWFATRQQVPKAWLLGLFAVAAFNRESAVFIGLYVLLSGLLQRAKGTALMGAALCVVSLVLTEVLRKSLFRYASLSGVGDDAAHAVFENHFNTAANWQLLRDQVRQATPLLFILGMYAVSLLLIVAKGIEQGRPQLTAAGLALGAYFASLGVFGILDELRLYQPFDWCLPLLLVACWQGPPKAAAPAAPPQPE